MERLEIIDTGRRRRFSQEMKRQVVAESFSEPGLCATTARRYGISRSQLYEWRRLARNGKFGGTVDGFVPALIVPEMAGPAISAKPVPGTGRMEVFSTNGRRVIADRDVDVEVLLRIVRGLENLR